MLRDEFSQPEAHSLLAQFLEKKMCGLALGIAEDEKKRLVKETGLTLLFKDRFEKNVSKDLTAYQADVLLLGRQYRFLLWWQIFFSSVQFLMIEKVNRKSLFFQLACLKQVFFKRLERTSSDLSGFEIYRVRYPRKRGTRFYFSAELGKKKFLMKLNEKGVHYCLLRWENQLDTLSDDEDLDLLIEDHDLPKVKVLLGEAPGTLPVDLYTVRGREGTLFRRKPYFPLKLAQFVLSRTFLNQEGIRIPDPEAHFASLAYHFVFHKTVKRKEEPRYWREFERLRNLGVRVPQKINTQNLLNYLEKMGFVDTTTSLKLLFSQSGKRARVEKIVTSPQNLEGMQYKVRKTYYEEYRDEFKNEVTTYRLFSDLPEILPILQEGDLCFELPYFDDELELALETRKVLPLRVAKKAFQFLERINKKGFTLQDFHPGNLLWNRRQGLRVVDLESCVPLNPNTVNLIKRNYQNTWQFRVGLSLESLMMDPIWLQQVKRVRFRARRLIKDFILYILKKTEKCLDHVILRLVFICEFGKTLKRGR